MDFSSYYYYIPLNFYETPEMTLIDHEPNGDSATVLVLALAKIHTRTVTKNDDGTFTIVTDDGTFTDTESPFCLLLLSRSAGRRKGSLWLRSHGSLFCYQSDFSLSGSAVCSQPSATDSVFTVFFLRASRRALAEPSQNACLIVKEA